MTSRPGWLEDLAEAIAVRLLPVDYLAPLGCHHADVNGVHEITLFAGSVETLGGVYDGAFVPSRFQFDMLGLAEIFENVTSFHWQPLTMADDDELGPHVAIEGRFNGHKVWVRILANAPESIASAVIADAYAGEFAEQW